MDGGAIFRVRDYAWKAVTGDMTTLRLHKNEVSGYAYNVASVLCKQIDQVMERKCFEETADGNQLMIA